MKNPWCLLPCSLLLLLAGCWAGVAAGIGAAAAGGGGGGGSGGGVPSVPLDVSGGGGGNGVPNLNPAIAPLADPSQTIIAGSRSTVNVSIGNNVTMEAAESQVLIVLDSDITVANFDTLKGRVSELGGRFIGQNAAIRMLQLEIPGTVSIPAAAAVLRSVPGVSDALPNYVASPDLESDPVTSTWGTTPWGVAYDWWINDIRAKSAWEVSTGSSRIGVGVVDTGLNLNSGHFDLQQDAIHFLGLFVGEDDDERHHGTGVASVLAASGEDGRGSAGVVWKNPVFVADIDFEYTPAPWKYFTFTLNSGIRACIDAGARVVNLSFGPWPLPDGTPGTPANFYAVRREFRKAMTPAVEYAAERDCLVVFSAGNDGDGEDRNHHPGEDDFVGLPVKSDDEILDPGSPDFLQKRASWLSHTIIVGATGGSKWIWDPNVMTEFSREGRVVDISAPGRDIGMADGSRSDAYVKTADGTSFAAPIVSGVAALAWGMNEDLTAAEVKEIVRISARVPSGWNTAAGGSGIVDAYAAVREAEKSVGVPVAEEMVLTLSKDDHVTRDIEVTTDTDNIIPLMDVLFLIDVSSSFSDDINTLQTTATTIADDLSTLVGDVSFGVASFSDFPVGSYGSTGDRAFELRQAVTSDFSRVLDAIDLLDKPMQNGGDFPESQFEALYQAVTGEGLDLNGDGDYDDEGEISPSTIGWRTGSLRVIICATDARFHDSDVESSYPGKGRGAALGKIRENQAMVIGLESGDTDGDLEEVVRESGGVLFRLGSDSSGMGTAIRDAVRQAVTEVTLTIVAVGDGVGFTDTESLPVYENVGKGETRTFPVTFVGRLGPDLLFSQQHKYMLHVRANNTATVLKIPVRVKVPGSIPFLWYP